MLGSAKLSAAEAIEARGGLVLLLYGAWLLAPWKVYEAYPTESPYAFAQSLWGSEATGGAIAAVLGVVSMIAGRVGWPSKARAVLQIGVGTYWGIVAVSKATWLWESTSTPIYSALTAIHCWTAWKLFRGTHVDDRLSQEIVARLPFPILFWRKTPEGDFALLYANIEAYKRIEDPALVKGVRWHQLSREDHDDFRFESGVRNVKYGPELRWGKRTWRRSAVAIDKTRGEFAEVLADVTDLADAIASVRRTNQDLEQFAYAASHDLQEPLRMISAWTSSLFEDYGERLQEPEATRMRDFIVGGVVRMQALIRDLLRFSRAGRSLQWKRVDLEGPILDAMDMLQTRLETSGARVEFGELGTVWGDEGMLALVFQNLISNSIKFCRKDEVPLISISCEVTGHWTELCVR